MLPIFTAEEMAQLDQATIEGLGIPGMVLMETAARGVFKTAIEILEQEYGPAVPLPLSLDGECDDQCCGECGLELPAHYIAEGRIVKIFCGKGNNGGDGLAVARMLDSAGAEVEVVLLGQGEELTGDAWTNYELVKKLEIPITEDAEEEDFYIEADCELVIDALLGTGIKGAPQGKIASAIEAINDAPCPVLSIDIPSGVMGSSGEAGGFAVIASATATMGALKRGLVFSPGRELAGEVSIVDIGIPAKVIKEFNPYLWLVEPQDIFGRLPVRREDTHKGECGRVFILAGSPGLTGAACMSAEACVKSGAGLVVLGIPQSSNQIIEIKLTEAMSQPLAENASGSLSLKAEAEIKERLKWATACAIGPGLSRNPETLELIRSIISSLEIPSVIDADALFALAEKPESLEKLPKKTILTPHLGEFARLLGKSAEEIKLERVELVREKARAWRTVIVLKGSPTLIASPEGKVFVNSSGNSGMATGGVGDVLTGVLSALLGAGLEPVDAAVAGVYIHGLAGDLAMEEEGIFGLSATDLLKELPSAFKEFSC